MGSNRKIKMELEIISKECIKPSSSTPSHLQTYKISLLDQLMLPRYYSIALFYPNSNNDLTITQRSRLLKHSLSKTLSHFYPLAGKIKDYLSIDCNDEGAYYIEAKVNIPLSEFLTRPDHTSLKKFVPESSLFNANPIGAYIVMIQETTFSCGGLALGIVVSHMVLDAFSFASFVKAWASLASDKQIPYPNLDSPSVFPQLEGFSANTLFPALWGPFAKKGKLAMRRLVFDASSIDKLKAKASLSVENPSRVEVVSAIITKTIKAALNTKSIAFTQAVNMRRKAMTPFPDCSLGNFIWSVHAFSTENEDQISSLVHNLRNAVRKVDNKFVNNIATEGGISKLYEEMEENKKRLSGDGMELVNFSSWCNFGVYDNTDFGFGKPLWMIYCIVEDGEEMPFYSMCNMNDTRSGNGVEAWLYLSQDVAAFVENDVELLQYASINPSPLSV